MECFRGYYIIRVVERVKGSEKIFLTLYKKCVALDLLFVLMLIRTNPSSKDVISGVDGIGRVIRFYCFNNSMYSIVLDFFIEQPCIRVTDKSTK